MFEGVEKDFYRMTFDGISMKSVNFRDQGKVKAGCAYLICMLQTVITE